jgi:hypothetical protein
LRLAGQEDRDWIVVHHRVPGISQPALMISLCAACHAIVERLQVLDVWLPPQLVILWREQHPGAEYQLPLPFDPFEQSRPASLPSTQKLWNSLGGFQKANGEPMKRARQKPSALLHDLRIAAVRKARQEHSAYIAECGDVLQLSGLPGWWRERIAK